MTDLLLNTSWVALIIGVIVSLGSALSAIVALWFNRRMRKRVASELQPLARGRFMPTPNESLSKAQMETLKSWDFDRLYERNKEYIFAQLEIILKVSSGIAGGHDISDSDIISLYKLVLEDDPVMNQFLASKVWISEHVRPLFIELFARYAVSKFREQQRILPADS